MGRSDDHITNLFKEGVFPNSELEFERFNQKVKKMYLKNIKRFIIFLEMHRDHKYFYSCKLDDFISPEYFEDVSNLHRVRGAFGDDGHNFYKEVKGLIDKYSAKSVLDYGCGKGDLRKCFYYAQKIDSNPFLLGKDDKGLDLFQEYDPVYYKKSSMPHPAELVVCFDVLEHVELDKLSNVLDHIFGLSKRFIFFKISTEASTKEMQSGRNAHVLIRDESWWRNKLDSSFGLCQDSVSEFEVAEWSTDKGKIRGRQIDVLLKRI